MGKKRKSIGNSRRFEIFKRDSFTCQYCGRTPPVAVLELDHVVAVANGGTNAEENLLTSCFECNHGKAARDLGNVPAPVDYKGRLAEKKERLKQATEYNQFLVAQRAEQTASVIRIGEDWYDTIKGGPAGLMFNAARVPTIRTFLKHLPEVVILECVEIAHAWGPCTIEDDFRTWRYFCGCCWKRIKAQ